MVTKKCKVSFLFQTLTVGVRSVSDTAEFNKRHISVTAEFDIFSQPSQKIVTIYKSSGNINSEDLSQSTDLEIKSSGLNINTQYSEEILLNKNTYTGEYTNRLKYHVGDANYDFLVSLKGNREKLEFLLRLFSTDLLKVASKINLAKDQQTIDSEISSYDNNPIISHLDIKNFNTLLFTIGHKSELLILFFIFDFIVFLNF